MKPEDHQRWEQTHEEVVRLVLARDYEGAIAHLRDAVDDAVARNSLDEAASYASFLSTACSLAGQVQDSLAASKESERLEPLGVHYKTNTARILLYELKEPDHALAKAEEAVALAPPGNVYRYGAVAILGTAKLATDDIPGAIEAFAENSAPETMRTLRKAEYAGVYDLGLVSAFIEAGVAAPQCEAYLREVRDVAASSGYGEPAIQAIDELLARISRSV